MPSYALDIPYDVKETIISGQGTLPVTSIGAGLASILTANEIMNIVLRRKEIVTAPRYTYMDLLDRQFVIGTVS
jgi:hypothetical protein